MKAETIDHVTLSRLVEAGAVRGAHIVGQPGGWAVMVQYGTHERPLAAQRSRQVRLFRRFETLVSYLKDVGLSRYDVDAANFGQPGASVSKRPDRAAAMKHTHEAAAYDAWFRAQVQEELDHPSPALTDQEAQAYMQPLLDSIKARVNG